MADNVLSKLIAAYVETNPDFSAADAGALRERTQSGNRLSSADRRLIEEMGLALVRGEYPSADLWLRRVHRRFGGERQADYKALRPYFSGDRQPEALFEADLLQSLRKGETNRVRFQNLTQLYRLYYTYFHQGKRADKPRHPTQPEITLLERVRHHIEELGASLRIRIVSLERLNELKPKGCSAESFPLINYNANTGELFLESAGAVVVEENDNIRSVGASSLGSDSLFVIHDPQGRKGVVARLDNHEEEAINGFFFDDLKPLLFNVFDEEALARLSAFVVIPYKSAPKYGGDIARGLHKHGFKMDVLSDPFVPFTVDLAEGQRFVDGNPIQGHTSSEPSIFHGVPSQRQSLTTVREAVKVVSHYVDSLNYRGFQDYWESLQAFFPRPEDLLRKIRSVQRERGGIVHVGDAGAGFAVFLRHLKQIFGDRVRTTGVDLVDWSNSHLSIYKSDGGFERYVKVVRFLGTDVIFPQWAPDHFLEENLETAQFPEPVDLLFASYTVKYLDDPLRGLVNLYNQLSVGGELYVTLPLQPHAVARIGSFSVDVIGLFARQLRRAGIDAELKKDCLMIRRKDDRVMKNLVSADADLLMQQEFQYVGYSQITSRNTPIFEFVEAGQPYGMRAFLSAPMTNGSDPSGRDLMQTLRDTEIQYPETGAVDFSENRKARVDRVYERLLESSGRHLVPLEDREFMSLKPSEKIQLYAKLSVALRADAEDSRWQTAARALMVLIDDLPRDDQFVLLAYVHDIVTALDFVVRPEASEIVKMITTEHARSAIDYFFYKAGTQIKGRKIAVSLDSIVMDSLGSGAEKEVRLRMGMAAFLEGLTENNRLFLYSSLTDEDMVSLFEILPRLKRIFAGIPAGKPFRPRNVTPRRNVYALKHQMKALDQFLANVEARGGEMMGEEAELWIYLSNHPNSALHLKHPELTRRFGLEFDTLIDTDINSIVLLETDGIANVDVFPLQRNLVPTGQVWDLYDSLAAGSPNGYRYSFSEHTRGHQSYPLETARIRFTGEDQLGRRRTAQQFARRIRELRAGIDEKKQLSLPFDRTQANDGSGTPQGGGGGGKRSGVGPRGSRVGGLGVLGSWGLGVIGSWGLGYRVRRHRSLVIRQTAGGQASH